MLRLQTWAFLVQKFEVDRQIPLVVPIFVRDSVFLYAKSYPWALRSLQPVSTAFEAFAERGDLT